MEYYSSIKMNEILTFATMWMSTKLSEIRSDTGRKILYVITYIWNLKNKTNKCLYRNRNRLTDIEHKFTVTKGERGGEG